MTRARAGSIERRDDAGSRRKVADITLAAHPECFRLAPGGPEIFVNLPGAGQIAVVDRTANRMGFRLRALSTRGDSDDLFVDSKRHRVYVTCGEGVIDVFSHEASGYQRIGRLETSSGARPSVLPN